MNWIFYTEVLWIMYQNRRVSTLPVFYFVSKPQWGSQPIKAATAIRDQMALKEEIQSIPPIRGPGKKLYLVVVSLLILLYISASLSCLPHCRGEHGVTGSWLATSTHQTHLPGLYPWHQHGCLLFFESSLLAVTMLVGFYRLVFSLFQGRNKCYGWRTVTVPYTGFGCVILYYIARMLLAWTLTTHHLQYQVLKNCKLLVLHLKCLAETTITPGHSGGGREEKEAQLQDANCTACCASGRCPGSVMMTAV